MAPWLSRLLRRPDRAAARLPGDGVLLWLHAASDTAAGPLSALLPALAQIEPPADIVLTGCDSLPEEVLADLPVDCQPAPQGVVSTRAFLDRWQPDLALMLGGRGLSGTMVRQVAGRAIPLLLICTSEAAALTRRQLRRFDQIFAPDSDSAELLMRRGLGEARLVVTGPIARDPLPPACDETTREDLARRIAGRPVWLALAPSVEEEAMIVAAQSEVARLTHRLLLILRPADPARGPELAALLRNEGWRVALHSAGEVPGGETQVFVADHAGEDGLWLRLAPLSFIGGTLAPGPASGPSPMAAAGLGSAILHGPSTEADPALFARLDEAGAARIVRDTAGLARVLGTLIAPERAAEIAARAWDVSSSGAAAAAMVAERVAAALPRQEGN